MDAFDAKMAAIVRWATIAVAVNFAVFVIVSLFIGGDAINGYSAGGHYFLNEKGRLTEVSRAVFRYSEWHTISVFVTIPIMLIVQLAWKRAKNSN